MIIYLKFANALHKTTKTASKKTRKHITENYYNYEVCDIRELPSSEEMRKDK